MKHYHGTPIGGTRQDVARFLVARQALVPFLRRDDMGAVAEFCRSFIFDNSAFSAWKRDAAIDFDEYARWVEEWHRHPGFDWALIPDVIDGTEADNDALIRSWSPALPGVPVWHMHESTERLQRLCGTWNMVALGSSGQFKSPGTAAWWSRIANWDDNRFNRRPIGYWTHWGEQIFGIRSVRDDQPTHWKPLPTPPVFLSTSTAPSGAEE